MRVLHLTTEFPPLVYGGLGTAVGGLVNASMQAGVEAGVLLVSSASSEGYGALLGALQYLAMFAVAPSIRGEDAAEVVRAWGPDLLHLHSFWLWPLARSLRERLQIPIVYTVHSLDRAEYDLGGGPGECLSQWGDQAAVIEGSDRIIALCRSEEELLLEYCPRAQGRVSIVANGIDDINLPERAGGKELTVLFVGRFVKRKGIHELMDAIGEVLPHLPNVKFVLAGGHRGTSAEDMRRWLLPPALKRFAERVQFTGWLSPTEVAQLYMRADILVVPSWYEPFGMVILEGMLYGLAVAASAVGGPAEIISHLDNGYLFPPQDSMALASAIERLCRDDEMRRRVSRAGAQSVRQRWLWPRTMARMRSVYDTAIRKAPPMQVGR